MTDKQHLQELAAYRFTVENLRARVAELESQLAAAPQAVQPVAWLAEYVDREGNSKWYVSTHKDLATENDMNAEPKPLYTHPTQQGLDAGAFEQRMSNWAQEDAQDAARYQWLREQHNKGDDSVTIFVGYEQHGPGHLDAQIDEALASQAKQGEQANG